MVPLLAGGAQDNGGLEYQVFSERFHDLAATLTKHSGDGWNLKAVEVISLNCPQGVKECALVVMERELSSKLRGSANNTRN
ncbi:hypothetical protein EFK07_05670 [Pseudomonas putida]|uniref:Uncharacterized protein n=1 Tax=Pseudomonas putida TaxID=303 RepID=A0A3M8THD6_PSEPU|nr:hypothetical protein EFK07_05670 [Pseudomonas putida]